MRKFIKCNDDNPSTWKKENHILKRNPPSNLDETHIHQCPVLVKIGNVNLLGRFGTPSIPSIPSNKPVVKLEETAKSSKPHWISSNQRHPRISRGRQKSWHEMT
jgi:hypothetical protein